MAAILIDYENVGAKNGLDGVEFLNSNDKMFIFYSNAYEKIRAEYIRTIEKSGCEFRIHKLLNARNNALDFYIATECGVLFRDGETQIAIISNDKGFASIIDFFKVRQVAEDMKVVLAPNIETGIMSLNSPTDANRRKLIAENSESLNLSVEYARIEERNKLRNAIVQAFVDTPYVEKAAQIIEYVEENREKKGRALYTSALHSFGRTSGTDIYKILKTVV